MPHGCSIREYLSFIPAGRKANARRLLAAAVDSWLGVLLLLCAASGCGTSPPSVPVGVSPQVKAKSADSPAGANESPAPAAQNAPRETWDVFYIEGSKIGHGWTRYERITEDGRELLNIKGEQAMAIQRFGQKITQQILLESWELPDGQVLRFTSEMYDGTARISSKGVYEKGRMKIETTTLGKTQTSTISWDPSWGGFFSSEQRLEQKPLKPGEKRAFLALMPVFNQASQVTFEATARESTELLDGKRELLRVKSTVQIGQTTITSDSWTDETGATLKSVLPSLNQVSYRTTKERALAEPAQSGSFDLGTSSVVKVERKLERPHDTRRIVYRATMPNGDPSGHFDSGASQLVRSIDPHNAEITVRALRPGSPQDSFPADAAPTDAERKPNGFIQSDDAEVKKLAVSVAAAETEPWKIACSLERLVRDTVRVKDFSQAVATAADVARSHEGDCTEHAVLLAAMCRARDIPARVAIGLVYFGPVGGFAYHMWTEVWIDRQWVPIDGTLGRGGIGAAHLKITHSSLEGSDSFTAFLPVIELLGQLKLEITSLDEGP